MSSIVAKGLGYDAVAIESKFAKRVLRSCNPLEFLEHSLKA